MTAMERIAALEARIAQLEARIAQMEASKCIHCNPGYARRVLGDPMRPVIFPFVPTQPEPYRPTDGTTGSPPPIMPVLISGVLPCAS